MGGTSFPRNTTAAASEVGSGSFKLEKHQMRLGHRATNLDGAAERSADFFCKRPDYRLCEPCIPCRNNSALPSWCQSSVDSTERNGRGGATVNLILRKQAVGHRLLPGVEKRPRSRTRRSRTLETSHGTSV